MDLTLGKDLLVDIANALIAAGPPAGALNGADIRLYQNDQVYGPASVIGDFVTADYTGYADEAVAWNAASEADDGSIETVGVVGEFRPSDAVTPNTIYGALLLDGAGALVGGAYFGPAGLPMHDALDAIVVVPRVRPTAGGRVDLVS